MVNKDFHYGINKDWCGPAGGEADLLICRVYGRSLDTNVTGMVMPAGGPFMELPTGSGSKFTHLLASSKNGG